MYECMNKCKGNGPFRHNMTTATLRPGTHPFQWLALLVLVFMRLAVRPGWSSPAQTTLCLKGPLFSMWEVYK